MSRTQDIVTVARIPVLSIERVICPLCFLKILIREALHGEFKAPAMPPDAGRYVHRESRIRPAETDSRAACGTFRRCHNTNRRRAVYSPISATPHIRAAEYVRMSTEHQQYSIENQADAIAQYAQADGMCIVRTYSDAAKSGLSIEDRYALRQLLQEVETGKATLRLFSCTT